MNSYRAFNSRAFTVGSTSIIEDIAHSWLNLFGNPSLTDVPFTFGDWLTCICAATRMLSSAWVCLIEQQRGF
jgi:hypothetical protein